MVASVAPQQSSSGSNSDNNGSKIDVRAEDADAAAEEDLPILVIGIRFSSRRRWCAVVAIIL